MVDGLARLILCLIDGRTWTKRCADLCLKKGNGLQKQTNIEGGYIVLRIHQWRALAELTFLNSEQREPTRLAVTMWPIFIIEFKGRTGEAQ